MTARSDLRGRLDALSRECRSSDRKGKGALLDEWSRRTDTAAKASGAAELPAILPST